MIHLVVILHFTAISLGMITLSMAWMKYYQQKDIVWQWIVYADLMFTMNMILDAIRIYFSKNVTAIPESFWTVLGIVTFLFSILTFVALVKLISNITEKRIPVSLILAFCLALVMPVAAPGLVSWIFDLFLVGCSLYAFTNLPQTPKYYRSMHITIISGLIVYWLIYTITNLLPGIPQWIFKIPFTQIIYLVINLLGLKYLLQSRQIDTNDLKEPENLETFGSMYGLTVRELEIVREILAGKNNNQIGEQLFISPNTVKNHIYNIYKKTGIKNRYELIVHFSQNGSVPF
ncbi:MAG: transcriptional regulator, LuxR family [Firmicutes bacterium]|nr:transcriptional regulator, LuxR family [Bacillota bacterium]